MEHVCYIIGLVEGKQGVRPPCSHLRASAAGAATAGQKAMHLLAVFLESHSLACGVREIESRACERHDWNKRVVFCQQKGRVRRIELEMW